MKILADGWLIVPEPRPLAKVQLLCCHHAGGGALSFRPWLSLLRNDTELLAVQLPGRENRFGQRAIADAGVLLDQLASLLGGALRRPYVMFGHSLGALILYQLTLRICATEELPLPEVLIVSAAPAPRKRPVGCIPRQPTAAESDETLTARIRAMGGTPAALLDNPQMMRPFLNTLRGDLRLAASLSELDCRPLPLPIVVLRGDADRTVPAELLQGWSGLSSVNTRQQAMPGGHFYVQTALPQVITLVNELLGSVAEFG